MIIEITIDKETIAHIATDSYFDEYVSAYEQAIQMLKVRQADCRVELARQELSRMQETRETPIVIPYAGEIGE